MEYRVSFGSTQSPPLQNNAIYCNNLLLGATCSTSGLLKSSISNKEVQHIPIIDGGLSMWSSGESIELCNTSKVIQDTCIGCGVNEASTVILLSGSLTEYAIQETQ